MSDDPRCGTYAGYNLHRRQRTEPCAACKAALATYQRSWRRRTGRTRELTAADIRQYVTGMPA